jgi:hypothetical protein
MPADLYKKAHTGSFSEVLRGGVDFGRFLLTSLGKYVIIRVSSLERAVRRVKFSHKFGQMACFIISFGISDAVF